VVKFFSKRKITSKDEAVYFILRLYADIYDMNLEKRPVLSDIRKYLKEALVNCEEGKKKAEQVSEKGILVLEKWLSRNL